MNKIKTVRILENREDIIFKNTLEKAIKVLKDGRDLNSGNATRLGYIDGLIKNLKTEVEAIYTKKGINKTMHYESNDDGAGWVYDD